MLADDWPQWRGAERDGVWRETGIIQSIPAEGLKVPWRIPIGFGFSSPVIVGGKVYVTDSLVTRTNAQEIVRCLDAGTGKQVWIHRYDVVYPEYGANPDHPFGPIATPVVTGGNIYTYGRMCDLACLDAANGRVKWSRNLPKDYQTTEDLRGPNSSPIVESNLVIIYIAKSAQISVVAFDKDTGRPVWEALDEVPSNTSPIVVDMAGRRQLIIWAYKSVAALDPMTGKIIWRLNIPIGGNYAVPTPVWNDDLLLLSGLMLKLDRRKAGASILWPSELKQSTIYVSDTSTPLVQNGVVFCPMLRGELRGLDASTGRQIWQADKLTESKNGASLHITAVPRIDRAFIFTDRGDLICARLDAAKYEEFGRFHLIEPTAEYGERKMAWTPPSYSGKRVFARNDKELVCASLAAEPTTPKKE